jgi:hypothetical protein
MAKRNEAIKGVLVWMFVAGCEPKGGDDLQVDASSEAGGSTGSDDGGSEELADSSETSDASESDDSSETEDSSETSDSGEPLPECPDVGTASGSFKVAFTGHNMMPGDTEDVNLERDATCMLTGSSEQGAALELQLLCDEIDGGLQQPYTITLETSPAHALVIAPDSPIQLSYRFWSGLEVGGGSRVTLTQDGSVWLLGFSESWFYASSDKVCSVPDGSLLVRANEWLDAINARVEPADCGDGSMFRLARSADDGEAYLFPGGIQAFDDGVTVVLEEASCTVDSGLDAEAWALDLVAWR